MRSLKHQAGLTLVELMVATTLSIVLLAGVLVVFSANKATYRMQNGLGTLQENGRYAIGQIAKDLQIAGYAGCQSPHLPTRGGAFKSVVSSSSTTDYLQRYVVDGELFGGVNDPSGTLTYGGVSMVPNTDAIEVRGPVIGPAVRVAGRTLKTGAVEVLGTSTGFANNEYLMISDCGGTTIFRASSVSTGSGKTQIAHSSGNYTSELASWYGPDALVMEIGQHTYFVGSTGRSNSSGQTITALYRFDGNNSVELVDGVENMQIEYGFDTDNDDDIDVFGTAADVNSGPYDWRDVLTVRISLLMNSVEGASAQEAPYTYFPSGSTAITPTSGDYLLRQEFNAMISIRNTVFPEI